MPSLCSKTLSIYVWEPDNTVYPPILIDKNPVSPIIGGQGGILYSTGVLYPIGKYKLELDTGYAALNSFIAFGMNDALNPVPPPKCNGTALVLSTSGGGGMCPLFPKVTLVPGGEIQGYTAISYVDQPTADAAAKAGTTGILLQFTLTAPTILQWIWGTVFDDFCGYYCGGLLGSPGHRYFVTRTAKLCGT